MDSLRETQDRPVQQGDYRRRQSTMAAINLPPQFQQQRPSSGRVQFQNHVPFKLFPFLAEPMYCSRDQIEGLLLKQSPVLGTYSPRYCIVQQQKFIYYEYSQGHIAKMLGILDFDQIAVQLTVTHRKNQVRRLILQPKGSHKKFIFKSHDKKNKDLKIWQDTIQCNIDYSQAKNEGRSGLVDIHRFWRHRIITNKVFQERVQSLDILLFQGKSVMNKMQRSVTNSQWDHVALLVREEPNIYLFEAQGQLGVSICKWSTFLSRKWPGLYHKVAHRQLILERSPELAQKLRKYINDNHGKQYSFKLFAPQKDKPENTFFCSQLVAACYIAMGVLDGQKRSHQFWPGDFSQENQVVLQNSVLGEECLIHFDEIPA